MGHLAGRNGDAGRRIFSRTRMNQKKLSVNNARAAEPRAARVVGGLYAQQGANVKSGRARGARRRKMALRAKPRIVEVTEGV